jgi:ABC-2 type transport system ATP-binding protein
MNRSKPDRLAAVKSFFDNGDIHLGYRRLLDSVIETQDNRIFKEALAFCDWYDNWSVNKDTADAELNTRVGSLLERLHHFPQTDEAPGILLQAKNISKRYKSGNFSLSPLDLTLKAGQITGLVGENGNGKTTLLRLLYGELKTDTGSIDYQLRSVGAGATFYAVKTRLAFIPQRPSPWYGSLMDNLQFAATHFGQTGEDNRLWTEMIIARMGLRPFRTYSWSRISSGYKMRFELARTLIKKPELLLLDEPLANLDVLAQQIILEDLKYIGQSARLPMSIILSSQQLYEVEKVSREVIFLQKGVARLQSNQPEQLSQAPAPLVLELETAAPREQLQALFGPQQLDKISFNGGVYILYFKNDTSVSQVMQQLGEAGLPVKYLRDISTSSRRFFDA